MRKLVLSSAVVVVLSYAAIALAQEETDCSNWCTWSTPCAQTCTIDGQPSTCNEYGVCTNDPDGDGLWNASDNCPNTYNPNQADCDGDGTGDVCDPLNANYVRLIGPSGCRITSTTYWVYINQTFYLEGYYEDQSSCGAPAKWQSEGTLGGSCAGFWWTEYSCCESLWGPTTCSVYYENNLCHY